MWSQTIGISSRNETGNAIINTMDGGFAIIGSRTSENNGLKDVYLVRISNEGEELWSHAYGGIYNDEGMAIRETADGGFIIAGYTNSFGNGAADFFLIRTESDGDEVWSTSTGSALADGSYSIVVDGVNYLAFGYTNAGVHGQRDMVAAKFNDQGTKLWSYNYGSTDNDVCFAACKSNDDNGFILVGSTGALAQQDVMVVKIDGDGTKLWDSTYNVNLSQFAYSVCPGQLQSYVIAGKSWDASANVSRMFLLKITDNGNKVFYTEYGDGTTDQVAFGVIQTENLRLYTCRL
ncbi:MAG: hypothetical protein IPO27_01800 [Bacteroidetes bacterium]|nr:hypothetical protein [Bacteroidota bacterium]